MKRAREEEAGPGASGAGGGGAGGGGGDAQAETARKALLLSTQALGVNAAAVRAARDDVDALFEAMLVWHERDKGGGRRFTADELLRVGSRRGKPVLVRLALERGADNARTSSRRHHLPVDMKRAREEDASPGASGAGGGDAGRGASGGGGASGAQAETARKALLLATQALGVNAAAVRAARDDLDAFFEAMLGWDPADGPFTADELLREGLCYSKPVLVRLALERGADIHASPHYGEKAAHSAAREGESDCLKLLLEAGVDKDVRDSRQYSVGMTVLETAALYGHADCVKVLLEAGADVDLANIKFGSTPLQRAASNGDSVCLKLLLEAGADVDKADESGTPLRAAVEEYRTPKLGPEHIKGQHVDCVRLLLEAGASVDAKTKRYARGEAAALIRAACSKDGGSAGRRRAR